MKRSQRMNNSPERHSQYRNEPHYNTYYQPVGKPPKRKRINVYFTSVYYICLHICIVYRINVYLSSRANVDDLKTIENKSSYVSADNMPDYVKGAFISMEDERFINTTVLM